MGLITLPKHFKFFPNCFQTWSSIVPYDTHACLTLTGTPVSSLCNFSPNTSLHPSGSLYTQVLRGWGLSIEAVSWESRKLCPQFTLGLSSASLTAASPSSPEFLQSHQGCSTPPYSDVKSAFLPKMNNHTKSLEELPHGPVAKTLLQWYKPVPNRELILHMPCCKRIRDPKTAPKTWGSQMHFWKECCDIEQVYTEYRNITGEWSHSNPALLLSQPPSQSTLSLLLPPITNALDTQLPPAAHWPVAL